MCSLSVQLQAAELTKEQLEAWFNDDTRLHPHEFVSNEGELEFLSSPPKKRTPNLQNKVFIKEDSLKTGWVQINQCYDELDPIEAVEVVYRYREMRGLKVQSFKNIDKAVVQGQSVQLDNVQKGAELCVAIEARILIRNKNGQYQFRNGPFQRRFLDSYFPMHVQLDVQFPENLLVVSSVTPDVAPGFKVTKEKNRLQIDAWFKGKLLIEVNFKTL